MAYTEFKYGVPYNNIRLGADVAQWVQEGQSYIDYASWKSKGSVSMAQLQALNNSLDIDPASGSANYQGYPFTGKKWGIGRASDANEDEGIFVGQAGGTSNWVDTRVANLASSPSNIKLSNLSGLNYTAIQELEGRYIVSGQGFREDFMILDQDFTEQYWSTTQPAELFTDEPLFSGAIRDDSANRFVYCIRTGINGDKFSDLTEENWIRASDTTDTNDILHMSAIRSSAGTGYNTTIPAFVTAGRRTSNSSNIKISVYLYNRGSNGLTPTLTLGAQTNVNYGSTNGVSAGLGYIADNRIMLLLGKGNNATKVAGLMYGSGWASGTVTSLGGGNTFGALRGAILTLRDEYNPSGQDGEAIAIWTGNKSTYNSNVYAQRIRQNGTTLTTSTQRTLITDSNDIKCANGCVAAMDNSNVWVAIIRSNVAGDGIVSMHKYSYGGDSWTAVGIEQELNYNDTSLNNIISVAPMARSYKNQNQFVGETFTPGQSNNFDRVVWLKVLLASNSATDDVSEYHLEFNLDTNTFLRQYNSNISQGRNSWVQKNEFDTNGRKWCRGSYPLAGGYDWLLTLGSYYTTAGGTVKAVNAYVNGLDKVYDWNVITEDKLPTYTNPTGPSGSEYITSTNVGAQGGPNSPSGGYVWGRWNVGPSIGKLNQNSFMSSSNYCTIEYYKKGDGLFYGSIGDGTQMIGLNTTDIDGGRWASYFAALKDHVDNGQNVTMRVENDSSQVGAFTISSTVGSGPTFKGEDELIITNEGHLVIRWTGGGNNHSGDSYSLWEGPSVNQLKIGFQYTL